jgi:hypothetical protein
MTTHIRVSSACTPTPLVAVELPLVLIAGRIKSPAAALFNSGRYCSTPLVGAEESGVEGIPEGIMWGRMGGGKAAVFFDGE